MGLKEIALEIREVLETRRKELELTFIEEDHIYSMKDNNGIVRNDFKSVSKIIDKFHMPFNAYEKSLKMARGDLSVQEKLLKQWSDAGSYSVNLGSRVHYELECDLINRHENFKEVRKPIYICDDIQVKKSDNMIIAGKRYLDLMLHEREAVLLDSEIVIGDPDLEYMGTPDKVWLMMNKNKTEWGFVITDWKTGKKKNFEVQYYSGKLYPPFDSYFDTSLTHYFLQLPLYGRLLIKMLENSKFKDANLFGCVIVLLKEDQTYEEFKVPQEFNSKILTMDLKKYVN